MNEEHITAGTEVTSVTWCTASPATCVKGMSLLKVQYAKPAPITSSVIRRSPDTNFKVKKIFLLWCLKKLYFSGIISDEST